MTILTLFIVITIFTLAIIILLIYMAINMYKIKSLLEMQISKDDRRYVDYYIQKYCDEKFEQNKSPDN
jgi:cell division protein FtsL